MANAVFDSLVKIMVGKGDRVLFWHDRWLQGLCVKDIAPTVWDAVAVRRRKKRTVQEALANDRWTTDIRGELPADGFHQYVLLSIAILNTERDPEQQDLFSWPCDPSGVFSAKSTYDRLCEGGIRFAAAYCIWKPWAPIKCKVFQWLAVRYRLWTTERRARHGLQDRPDACYLCLQEIDSVDHMLMHCSYAREVWFESMWLTGLPDVTPLGEDKLEDWWLRSRQRVVSSRRKEFDARVMLTCWLIWKQRNARVFVNLSQHCSARVLVDRISDEFAQWNLARVSVGPGGSTIRFRE
jgi:hypothetical protein